MYNDKKKMIIIVMLVVIGILTIAYATFSTKLTIDGTANIASEWNVYFSEIETTEKVGEETDNNAGSPAVSKLNAVMNLNLKEPGDYIVYTITLTNAGTLDAVIDSIDAYAEGTGAIVYSIEGISIGDKITKNTDRQFTVKVEYDPRTTHVPEDTTKELTITMSCIQDISDIDPSEPDIIQPLLLSTALLKNNQVQSDGSIDFSKTSSDTNGKGLYYTSDLSRTEDVDGDGEGERVYYFRGDVNNNFVKFGKNSSGKALYWKIIRINEDGSVRMIYNGTSPNGTKYDVDIGATVYENTIVENGSIGYMNGDPGVYTDSATSDTISINVTSASSVKLALSYDFDENTGKYKLLDSIDVVYNADNASTANYNGYFRCESATAIECNKIYKISETVVNDDSYTLKTKVVRIATYSTNYNEAHANISDSAIKTFIDAWYEDNLLIDYSEYLHDAGFCNDRSITSEAYKNAGYGGVGTRYAAIARFSAKTPQFSCPQQHDLFTTNTSTKGNKALKYPIGLITADEAWYAGVTDSSNTKHYLYTGLNYFTMTPYGYLTSTNTNMYGIRATGYIAARGTTKGDRVRPVINLKPMVEVTGKGTKDSPYVVL